MNKYKLKAGNESTIEKIFTGYCPEHDMTFILKDTITNGKEVSTEVIGFYFGGPDEQLTKRFTGKLKAEYNMEAAEAFMTVKQLLSLLATDNCQIDFYDSTHQIEEMLTERDLREGKNKYNWMDAKVEYFNIVGVDDINLCCLLKEAEV